MYYIACNKYASQAEAGVPVVVIAGSLNRQYLATILDAKKEIQRKIDITQMSDDEIFDYYFDLLIKSGWNNDINACHRHAILTIDEAGRKGFQITE